MSKYLIDVNLPYRFALWHNTNFIHVKDLDDTMNDDAIWQYAHDNNLIIVTKDSDFAAKVFYKGCPPKVIHCKFGNLRLKDFHSLISKIWPEIEIAIIENNMINIYLNRIEIIK